MIINKIGNILDSEEQYILHQTNCISKYSAGLAKQLFNKYPYANSYINRTMPSVPGTIEIKGDGDTSRFIINLYGQYAPGNLDDNSLRDQRMMRIMYFHSGIDQISKIQNVESIAVPYKIGCGLAGGDWDYYLNELKELDYRLSKLNKDFRLVIYEYK